MKYFYFTLEFLRRCCTLFSTMLHDSIYFFYLYCTENWINYRPISFPFLLYLVWFLYKKYYYILKLVKPVTMKVAQQKTVQLSSQPSFSRDIFLCFSVLSIFRGTSNCSLCHRQRQGHSSYNTHITSPFQLRLSSRTTFSSFFYSATINQLALRFTEWDSFVDYFFIHILLCKLFLLIMFFSLTILIHKFPL